MKKLLSQFATLALVAVVAAGMAVLPAYAAPGGNKGDGSKSSPAAAKAVMGTNYRGVTFTEFKEPSTLPSTESCSDTGFDEPNALCTEWYALFDEPEAIKTSSQGAIEAVVSLECSIWTTSQSIAQIAGTGSGGARAGVEVRVKIDGQLMHPGEVVYCDRLQWIQLTVPGLFDSLGGAVTSTDPFVLDFFQRTKSAHGFHFYLPTPATDIHSVLVEVRGIVQCSKDGMKDTCENAGVDDAKFFGETIDAGTRAAIGKSTLVVEEHSNWSTR